MPYVLACAEPAASGLVLNLITSACAEPCSARLMFWLVLKLLHLAKMSAPRCVSQKAYSTTATALASPTQNSSMRCTWSKFLLQHLSDCSRCVVQEACSTTATVLASPTQNSSRRCTWSNFQLQHLSDCSQCVVCGAGSMLDQSNSAGSTNPEQQHALHLV